MTVADYFLPRSLPEALELLREHGPSLLVMAGGTVTMPLINEGISLPRQVMGLRFAGLDGLEPVDGGLRIGAAVTLTGLLRQRHVPMLAQAARRTASWSIRNMGTVGGNLFTPPPGGDVAVALLALDAQVEVRSRDASRTLPLSEFQTGFMTTALEPGELVTGIGVPAVAGETAYLKFGRKEANTPSVVTVAVRVRREEDRVVDARVALGAVGPHALRASRAEAILVGSSLDPGAIDEAAEAAAAECDPFDDGVASAWYRRAMVRLFVRRALEGLAQPVAVEGR
ncbi:MAG: FAD binding domain-containing protein [Chloroflexi bacterium]|nr:FAD binding domain-containing protein [Chloroflexota bacterium]